MTAAPQGHKRNDILKGMEAGGMAERVPLARMKMVEAAGKYWKGKLDPDELALPAQRKGMNAAARQISKLNSEAEQVRKSREMSPEAKRKRLDQIQEQKNGIAGKIVRELEAKGWAA
jgi:hypothetical protein